MCLLISVLCVSEMNVRAVFSGEMSCWRVGEEDSSLCHVKTSAINGNNDHCKNCLHVSSSMNCKKSFDPVCQCSHFSSPVFCHCMQFNSAVVFEFGNKCINRQKNFEKNGKHDQFSKEQENKFLRGAGCSLAKVLFPCYGVTSGILLTFSYKLEKIVYF